MALNEKIAVELATVNPINGEYIYADLLLPASPMEIEDAMQRARLTENYGDYCDVNIISCPYLRKLEDTRIDGKIHLKELNLFAKRVTVLSEDELLAMEGIFTNQQEKGKYADGVSVEELINLTYGLSAVPVIHGIYSDEMIGEFVIENELNEELLGLSDDALKFVDKNSVGKEHREMEGGRFVNGNYVATAVYSFPKEYKGATAEQLEVHNTIAFALKVAEAPVNDSQETEENAEWIYLPLDKNEANRVARLHNEGCIEDCVYIGFESAFDGIDGTVFGDMQDFDKLNKIAEKYVSLSETDRVKFKAVIGHIEPATLDKIQEAVDHLQQYEFAYYDIYAEDFAKDYLKHHLPTNFDSEFLDDIPLARLGDKLLDRLNATVTGYGVLSDRGRSLYEIVPYRETEQEQKEEMGGMSM